MLTLPSMNNGLFLSPFLTVSLTLQSSTIKYHTKQVKKIPLKGNHSCGIWCPEKEKSTT